MAKIISLAKIFLVFLGLFYCMSPVFAQTGPVSTDVNVSASVGDEVIEVTPGGSSSGGIAVPATSVRFSGQAYPGARVSLLKLGAEQAFVFADNLANFSITLPEAYDANILYSLVAEDVSGERSLIINYPIGIRVGFLTHLSGIKFPPTIVTDKIEVRSGDYLTVNGSAIPNQSMEVVLEGPVRKIFSLVSGQDGSYKIVLPMVSLPKGDYSAHVNYFGDSRVSKIVKFIIGDVNIFKLESLQNIPGDCNSDKNINLVDFSVLAFWYGKSNPPSCVDTNSDSKIDLVDFSILAFYWNG